MRRMPLALALLALLIAAEGRALDVRSVSTKAQLEACFSDPLAGERARRCEVTQTIDVGSGATLDYGAQTAAFDRIELLCRGETLQATGTVLTLRGFGGPTLPTAFRDAIVRVRDCSFSGQRGVSFARHQVNVRLEENEIYVGEVAIDYVSSWEIASLTILRNVMKGDVVHVRIDSQARTRGGHWIGFNRFDGGEGACLELRDTAGILPHGSPTQLVNNQFYGCKGITLDGVHVVSVNDMWGGLGTPDFEGSPGRPWIEVGSETPACAECTTSFEARNLTIQMWQAVENPGRIFARLNHFESFRIEGAFGNSGAGPALDGNWVCDSIIGPGGHLLDGPASGGRPGVVEVDLRQPLDDAQGDAPCEPRFTAAFNALIAQAPKADGFIRTRGYEWNIHRGERLELGLPDAAPSGGYGLAVFADDVSGDDACGAQRRACTGALDWTSGSEVGCSTATDRRLVRCQ